MQDEEIKKNKDHQDGGIMFWYFVIFDKKEKILYLIECVYVQLFVI